MAVRALHRPGADLTHLEEVGCELVAGDLSEAPDRLAARIEGCDAVVHSAALVYAPVPPGELHRVNVIGAGRVVEAAGVAGVSRAVHLSSVAVYGAGDRGRDRGGYAHSKVEAEASVRAAAGLAGLELTILRPSAVYGERDRLFTPRVLRLLRRRLHPLLGGGRTPLPLVYAGNLAEAVRLALGRGDRVPGAPPVRVYDVSGDHPVTQAELWGALARELGMPFRPVTVPAGVARAVARGVDALGIPLPGADELPARRLVELALSADPYGSERIRSELGWTPPISTREAVRRTARWFGRPDRAARGDDHATEEDDAKR